MAEREPVIGKAGASCWVETLLEATNAASDRFSPVAVQCAVLSLSQR